MRHAVRAVVGVAAVLWLGTVTVGAPAWAAGGGLVGGQQVTGLISPIGHYTPGAPVSSGQVVEVSVPPNHVLPKYRRVNIVECSASVLHASSAAQALGDCDGTTIQGDTVLVRADGSVDYRRYTIFALPDTSTLGESAKSSPVCNRARRCVLYVGTDQTNIPSSAHFFSPAWTVNATPGDSGRDPGSGVVVPPSGSSATAAIAGAAGGVVIVAGIILLGLRFRARRRVATSHRVNAGRNGSGTGPGSRGGPAPQRRDRKASSGGRRAGTHDRDAASRVR